MNPCLPSSLLPFFALYGIFGNTDEESEFFRYHTPIFSKSPSLSLFKCQCYAIFLQYYGRFLIKNCNHSQYPEAISSVALGMICFGQEVFSLSEIYLFTLHATVGEVVADDVEFVLQSGQPTFWNNLLDLRYLSWLLVGYYLFVL